MNVTAYLLSTFSHGAANKMRSLAFNAANKEIAGYKPRHITQHPFTIYPEKNPTPFPGKITYPVEGFLWKDNRQAPLKRTEDPLQVAIKGEGFFELTDGTYTRDGKIMLTPDGVLTTPSGHEFADVSGGQIRLSGELDEVRIDRVGFVRNSRGETLGQLRIVEFEEPDKLKKIGENRLDGSNAGPKEPVETRILQGFIEGTNINLHEVVASARETVTDAHRAAMMYKNFYETLGQLTHSMVHIGA